MCARKILAKHACAQQHAADKYCLCVHFMSFLLQDHPHAHSLAGYDVVLLA